MNHKPLNHKPLVELLHRHEDLQEQARKIAMEKHRLDYETIRHLAENEMFDCFSVNWTRVAKNAR